MTLDPYNSAPHSDITALKLEAIDSLVVAGTTITGGDLASAQLREYPIFKDKLDAAGQVLIKEKIRSGLNVLFCASPESELTSGGVVADCDTHPSSTLVLSITRNGTAVGQVQIAPNGSARVQADVNTRFLTGDVLRVVVLTPSADARGIALNLFLESDAA